MNALLAASLLTFLAALATFGLRGVGAQHDATQAAVSLQARCDDLSETLGQTRPVSWARLAELEQASREANRAVDARLSQLLDPLDAAPPLTWGEVVASSSLPSLQPGQPLRQRLDQAVAQDPGLGEAAAALVHRLDAEGAFDLEDLTDLGPAPNEALPELATRQLECVVLAELPSALALLERLVPRPAPLLLSISSASVRRITPGLWPADPSGLGSPPVRLWFRLDATRRAEGR